ncbi:MAG: hypothetical protein ACI9OJ_003289 [Myxococcota bacterium]|jgi:hypothetical protein
MTSPFSTLGRQLVERGLRLDSIVVDLDETIWDWCYLMARQPRFFREHTEIIYLRRPTIELLRGIQAADGGRLRAWTAGYGHRVDQICDAAPPLGQLFGYGPHEMAEAQPHIATRRDFLTAIRRQPSLVPRDGERWIAQKMPNAPTTAGKPIVDDATIMLDDKQSNCQRFVDSAPGRSALWLRGAPRIWKNNLRWVRTWAPACREWATGAADALGKIVDGQSGLYAIDPVASTHTEWTIRVSMPHQVVWNDWIAPGREIDRVTGKRA